MKLLLHMVGENGAIDGIRTHTWWILSPLPLPLGYNRIFNHYKYYIIFQKTCQYTGDGDRIWTYDLLRIK